MQWLLFTDKNFLHFVVLKVLQDGEIIVVVCVRRLIILVATFCGFLRQLFSLFVIRREIVGHQGYNITVRYRENTGNATQIISVNIIHYYIYTTLSQIKCLHQARRRLPKRTVCDATCYKCHVTSESVVLSITMYVA